MVEFGDSEWESAAPIFGKNRRRRRLWLTKSMDAIVISNFLPKFRRAAAFENLRSFAVVLGSIFDQDEILIVPPKGTGFPHFVYTNSRAGAIGETGMVLNTDFVSGIFEGYFVHIARKYWTGKISVGTDLCFRAPSETLQEAEERQRRGELPMFGSHLMSLSTMWYKEKE